MNLKPQITTTFTHIILLLLSSSYFFFLLQRTLSPLVNSSLVADPKRPMSHPYFYLCHNLSTQPKLPPHMNKEEKTETPSFLSKNTTLEKILLVRDRTFDL